MLNSLIKKKSEEKKTESEKQWSIKADPVSVGTSPHSWSKGHVALARPLAQALSFVRQVPG